MVNNPLYIDGERMDMSTTFISRAENLGNPDVILVCGGAPDNWNSNIEKGEFKYSDWTEEDKTQFRPGTAYLLSTLATKYPDAKVYFVLNDILDNISEDICTICAHYNVEVIKPQGIEKCSDGHPTAAGMTTMAEAVKTALKNTQSGIEAVCMETEKADDAWYDIQGRKVLPDTKGLVISKKGKRFNR